MFLWKAAGVGIYHCKAALLYASAGEKAAGNLEDGEIDDTGVPQPQLEQTAERTALLQALDQLNETERQIVLLYAAAGMKHREIAQVLNMPQATELPNTAAL